MERSSEILKLVEAGNTTFQIATILDISPTTVRYWLKKLRIVLPKSEPKPRSATHADLIGKEFGSLEITELVQTAKSVRGTYRAICKCKCGTVGYETSIQNIIRGSTTSCGCRIDWRQKFTGKNNSQYTGYEEIRGRMWSKVIELAKRREIPFEITIEYAWDVFLSQNKRCALSGIELRFGGSVRSADTTASLDRINSKIGYIHGNVQWVLKDINMMKHSLPQARFLELCTIISQFKQEK